MKFKNVDHVFVFGHQPAFPAGRHVGLSLDQYPKKRDAFWKLLRQYNVDAYFCGHEHFWAMKVVDGIYQITSGTCGAPIYGGFGGSFYHYALVTVDGKNVRVVAKDEKGKVRRDFSFNRKDYPNVTLADAMNFSESKILKEIKTGPYNIAWKSARAAGLRKIKSAIPLII
jgi:hypothetical protein